MCGDLRVHPSCESPSPFVILHHLCQQTATLHQSQVVPAVHQSKRVLLHFLHFLHLKFLSAGPGFRKIFTRFEIVTFVSTSPLQRISEV